MMWLYDLKDSPIRKATADEESLSKCSTHGIITVDGVQCYADDAPESAEETAEFLRSWRDEMAREAGMLHGVNAYNDFYGYQ